MGSLHQECWVHFFFKNKIKRALPAKKLFPLTTEDPGFSWQSERKLIIMQSHFLALMNQAESWEGGKVFRNPCWWISFSTPTASNPNSKQGVLASKSFGRMIFIFPHLWNPDLCFIQKNSPMLILLSIPTPLFLCPLISALGPSMVLSFDSVNNRQLFCVYWPCSCSCTTAQDPLPWAIHTAQSSVSAARHTETWRVKAFLEPPLQN